MHNLNLPERKKLAKDLQSLAEQLIEK